MDIDHYILNQIAGNVYWKDRNGVYLGCNDAFAKACGLKSPKDIIGKVDSDFIKNSDNLDLILQTDLYVLETGAEHSLEEMGLDENGNSVIYLSKKAPLRDKNNNVIGVIGTSINVRNNFTLKDYILRHTTGNVYWKDLEGRYLGCNKSYADMIRLDHPNEIIGKSDKDLFLEALGEERLQAIIELDKAVLTLGVEKIQEEVGVDRDNKLAIYLTKKIPIRDNQNKIIGLVGSSLDITKQKQAELAKLEFLRNMSHDIMTPFTGIQGIASILYEEENNPEKKLHLKLLLQSSERLLQLFKQILEIAEVGDSELKIESFNLRDLITQCIDMVSVNARLNSLSLTFEAENVIIKNDKLKCSRIILNLLSNAIKFTESGSIHVTAQCQSELSIKIKDTGIGIPQDKLSIIFEKFEKLSASGKHNKFMGSGIGLYIARRFARELGGDILVKSKVGKGSTFTFSAPIRK